MEITLTTPALLFPALSLLLLAYTNRFLSLADRVRGLKARYENAPHAHLLPQIHNLRRRLVLLRNMQAVGTGSIFGCVLTMFVLFAGFQRLGEILFSASLLALLVSLSLALIEIQISVEALNIELDNLQTPPPPAEL
jgi:prepilin signal peptidase PulO-like enzyme (type II secretory pathway)